MRISIVVERRAAGSLSPLFHKPTSLQRRLCSKLVKNHDEHNNAGVCEIDDERLKYVRNG